MASGLNVKSKQLACCRYISLPAEFKELPMFFVGTVYVMRQIQL